MRRPTPGFLLALRFITAAVAAPCCRSKDPEPGLRSRCRIAALKHGCNAAAVVVDPPFKLLCPVACGSCEICPGHELYDRYLPRGQSVVARPAPPTRRAWEQEPATKCCRQPEPEPGRTKRCRYLALKKHKCTAATKFKPTMERLCPVACGKCTICKDHPLYDTYENLRKSTRWWDWDKKKKEKKPPQQQGQETPPKARPHPRGGAPTIASAAAAPLPNHTKKGAAPAASMNSTVDESPTRGSGGSGGSTTPARRVDGALLRAPPPPSPPGHERLALRLGRAVSGLERLMLNGDSRAWHQWLVYTSMVALSVQDGSVAASESAACAEYRRQFEISTNLHARALQMAGWSRPF